MSEENEQLKEIKCTSCGGSIVESYRVEEDDDEEIYIPVAKCSSCNTEYDQYTQLYYQFFADNFKFNLDTSVFKLGLKGTLDGVEYEIIGRLRYQDEEDYEIFIWDEWVAMSSDGRYHYFVEEEGKLHSYADYTPETMDMESSYSHIYFEGKKVLKSSSYVARIVYAEGELPWEPEIGEPVTCYDFKKDGYSYNIEKYEDEISISKGDRIKYGKIIEAFGRDDFKKLYDTTITRRKTYKNKARVYLIGIIVTFLFSVVSCFSYKQIQKIMDNRTIISNNTEIVENNKRIYFSQILYGPFTIPQKDKLYDLELKIDETIDRLNLEWQSFRIMLLNETRLNKVTNNQENLEDLKKLFNEIDILADPVESFMFTGDFWDEEGYDSDGYWHESDINASTDFVIDEKGKHYAYLELYNNKKRNIDSVKIKLGKVSSYRYYIIIFVIFIILYLINLMKSKSYNELPFDMASE